MIAKKPQPPSYRRHRSNGLDRGFVELNGKRMYLGRYDSTESRQRYDRLIAEWLANGRRLPVDPRRITVVELVDRFWQHAKTYYRRPDGTATSSLHNYRAALRPLKRLYGSTPAVEFGPRALKTVRQSMIDAGWTRGVVNQTSHRVRAVFRWGVSEQLIPSDTHAALTTVAPLRRGRSDARESDPVKPVPQAHIDAVRPHVGRQVSALIELQLHTGARAGELVLLRPIDFDTSGKVWTAIIAEHKTAHHGRERVIYFGPQAQSIIRHFIAGRPIDAYLFSPREAEVERAARAPTHRRPGQRQTCRQTDRRLGDRYTTDSYRRAITRACGAAGVDQWSPGRLRHNSATAIRRRFGIEAAQLLLGHAEIATTQIYAEVNHAKALEVAAKVG